MKKHIIVTIFLLASMAWGGCKDYLEVFPKSSVSEDQIFETSFGFQQALIGTYVQMASPSLYGNLSSLGFVSALGQDYLLTNTSAVDRLDQAAALNYQATTVLNSLEAIWNTSYSIILNANKILQNEETHKGVLTDAESARIRGEALGLRAYLHFDLLRLFGPHPVTGASAKAIPYRTFTNQTVKPASTTSEMITFILNDLQQASVLLKSVDADITTMGTRRIKMNYFAVKALEARVRLYNGDKTGAFTCAKEVVDSKAFPFISAQMATHSDVRVRDRMYIPELVFAIRVADLSTVENNYFRQGFAYGLRLNRDVPDINAIYENSATDIRRNFAFELDASRLYTSKYWQLNTLTSAGATMAANSPLRTDHIIPLIRISELYYIMAETAATSAEGVGYLNLVRTARGLSMLPNTIEAQTLQNEITKEYRKEFYAEGQVFYYYKRKQYARLPFMASDISLSKYQLPIPVSELEFNPSF